MYESYGGISLLFTSEPLVAVLRAYCSAVAAEKGFLAYCLALYDYAASEPNQLSISSNDVIGILNKAGDSHGWWKGYLNGRVRVAVLCMCCIALKLFLCP